MSQRQPRILFLTLADDVGSERIVSEMGRRGAACAVLGRAEAIAAQSVRVAHRVCLPALGGMWGAALGAGSRLEGLSASWRPDAVVPLDDMAAGLLRDVFAAPRTTPALRTLIARSLGDPAHHATASCRGLLIEAAAALGIRTPAQRRAGDLASAQAAGAEIGYPLMLKREATCGGSGVTLVRDASALAAAYRTAARRARVKRALRAAVGLDFGRSGAPVTLQAHVVGVLGMRTVACRNGQVLDGISFVAERLDPPVTGSSTVVRPLDHPEMDEAARRLVEALGCSGFVSFDFILAADGSAHLIEMNARPVGSGHLGARFGHDVYGAWLRTFPGFSDLDPPRAGADQTVALFPKEVGRDPASADLARPDILHDVPWDEPQVLAAYRARVMRRHPGAEAALARSLPVPALPTPDRRPARLGVARLWT